MILPQFIYIGMGKAGTTWLYEALRAHPRIFIAPVKETNFFDLNFERGIDWYASFFGAAKPDQVVGEISHRYIHRKESAGRIFDTLGPVKIIVGFREPVDYCISDFLFACRNGRFEGDLSAWCRTRFDWDTIDYRGMLEPFLHVFGRDRILIYDFDELRRDPRSLYRRVTTFLDVGPAPHRPDLTAVVNAAASPRNASVALAVNKVSKFLKRRGGQRLIALVKYRPIVQRLLYKPLQRRPSMPDALREAIRDAATPGIEWVDEAFQTTLQDSWYGSHRNVTS